MDSIIIILLSNSVKTLVFLYPNLYINATAIIILSAKVINKNISGGELTNPMMNPNISNIEA